MDEEWQLLIELDAEGALAPLADEIVAELGEEVGLHRAGKTLVAYADTADGAAAAEQRLRRALEKRALGHLQPRVERWDHERQEWTGEHALSAEPSDGEQNLGRSRQESRAAEATAAYGSWTVTVSLPHHRDAKRLVEELSSEGYEVSSSWHGLKIATTNRHDADLVVAEIGLRAPDAETEITSG